MSLEISLRTTLSLLISLIAASCGPNNSPTDEDLVSWPEITRFDDLAFRADGFARVNDFSAIREIKKELLDAAKAVTSDSIPSNVADLQQVELVLDDLAGLVKDLATEDLDDASLKNIVLGLHPVIAKLIEVSGIPHIHANEGPNGGFLFPVFDKEGKQSGTVEIKLHDDAGDLEVWLKKGGYEGEPWRLPLKTTLTLAFPSEGKKVILAVRDTERNEDESGQSTISDGKTNYFVFPADTGVDASWLMGSEFAAKAELSFGTETTGSFVLRPHVHREKAE
tara:strand:- start:388 stop:1227 length:840 start_codon:yes stop_codon:yes gene_type:complete